MQVRVLFFGMLKDLAGRSSEALTLPDQATAGDVLQHYAQHIPPLKAALSAVAISVNQQYARPEDKLRAGDEVGLLPPVSGGSNDDNGEQVGREEIAIVRERIDTAAVLARIKRPEDGAVVVFEGIVRSHTRNRRTLFLDYEAYEEMALKQLESLAERARSQFQIREVAIVHRLGRLEIGETSVLIVVASAHRAPAFEACRWLIDTLKRTVPVWKKEHFADGAVWADGEPFPEQLTPAQIHKGTHPNKQP
jgi:molybdopterin converting factor subunit 1